MISNPQDYIFYSEFQYPPKISSGSTDVASGDFNLKVLATGVTLDNDWSVYEERVLGSTGETIIQKSLSAYVKPNGELVASATFAPSRLVWRVYGY